MKPGLSREGTIALLTALLLALSSVGPAAIAQPAGGGAAVPTDEGGVAAATNGGEADGESRDEAVLETAYARIEYHEDYEAERIAAVVDDHYELLHQLFSVYPPEERVEVRVAPETETPCDTTGCTGPLGAVYLSSDSRSLLHHELVHVIQLREHWSVTNWLSPPEPAEGALIEGTAEYLGAPVASLERRARFDHRGNRSHDPPRHFERVRRARAVRRVRPRGVRSRGLRRALPRGRRGGTRSRDRGRLRDDPNGVRGGPRRATPAAPRRVRRSPTPSRTRAPTTSRCSSPSTGRSTSPPSGC